MKRMFTWKNIFFATLVYQATKARTRGLFLASKTQLFLAVKLQVFHFYKYKHIARQLEELTHTKIQKTLHTHKQKFKSSSNNKPLNKTFFLSHHHQQTKIKQKNNISSSPKQTKIKQNNPHFFSFFLFQLSPQRYIICPFSSFLFLLLLFFSSFHISLSLSLVLLSLSLYLFFFIYFTLNTHKLIQSTLVLN